MTTYWVHNSQTETKRIVFTAINAANGFYNDKGFYLIPYEEWKKFKGPIVLLPLLGYGQIPRFWQRVKNARASVKSVFEESYQKELEAEIEHLLRQKNYSPIKYEKLQQDWSRIEKELFLRLDHILPEASKRIQSLTIIPTRFGTNCSFPVLQKFPGNVIIFLREDRTVFEIAEAILASISRYEAFRDLSADWESSELLVDWLLTKTPLKDVIGKVCSRSYRPTIKTLSFLQNGRLKERSNLFYEELGISLEPKKVLLKDGKVRYGEKIIQDISEKEYMVLFVLTENRDRLLTYHEISQILYRENSSQRFSLWAIAKFIQRLRDKLEKQGVGSHHLQTVYGKGIVLKGLIAREKHPF